MHRTRGSSLVTHRASAHLCKLLQLDTVVLLGVGNPLRGDDAIGYKLAESLVEFNNDRFQSHPVGTPVENAMSWVRQAGGGVLILADAVFDESLPEGSWAFYPTDRLDTFCHTTHSIPLSLLISFWQQEVAGLEVHFLGISIRNNTDLAPLSAPLNFNSRRVAPADFRRHH